MTAKVLVTVDDPVMIITINRPERRNAVDNETAALLTQAFRAFESDGSRHVAVLTGAGEHFCAGADLKSLGGGEMYIPWGGHPDGPCHQPLSKPLIAAIEGYACAGGVGLALRCDLRVAAQGARFAILSRRWGVPMSDGTTIRLPRLIGQSRAVDMLMTAREVPAEEAHAIGLVDRLVPKGGALQAAIGLAKHIAAFPQAALLADRASAFTAFDNSLADALQRETAISKEAREQEAVSGAERFAKGQGRHGSLPG
jgi:enoyl-CoA hydratase